jgi:hypothetical protein
MSFRKDRLRHWLLGLLGALLVALSPAVVHARLHRASRARVFTHHLSFVAFQPQAPPAAGINLVNRYRISAGVPPAAEDRTLDENCVQHARYMAENGILTHEQDPDLPYATDPGQYCAEHSNTWLGSKSTVERWNPTDAIEGWMGSVGHRLWLLYPTTRAFGYGFYPDDSTRAAAAIDVMSFADFAADERYTGWPVRSPGANEQDVPAVGYPITLNWRYFGPAPSLEASRLTTADGASIPHDANTNLPAGHKGIQLIPRQPLPTDSELIVIVTGRYEGKRFSYQWRFVTGQPQTYYP